MILLKKKLNANLNNKYSKLNLNCYDADSMISNKNLNYEVKISLNTYYIYKIKITQLYINLINKKFGTLIINGYQIYYPYWTTMFVKGSVVNIKKNMFSTRLGLTNYIDGFYIKKYIYIFSSLLSFIYNQAYKKLRTISNKLKKKYIISSFLHTTNKSIFKLPMYKINYLYKFWSIIVQKDNIYLKLVFNTGKFQIPLIWKYKIIF